MTSRGAFRGVALRGRTVRHVAFVNSMGRSKLRFVSLQACTWAWEGGVCGKIHTQRADQEYMARDSWEPKTRGYIGAEQTGRKCWVKHGDRGCGCKCKCK